jgi:hypothetical protein
VLGVAREDVVDERRAERGRGPAASTTFRPRSVLPTGSFPRPRSSRRS